MDKNMKEYIRQYKYKSVYFKLLAVIICFILIPSVFTGAFIYNKATQNFGKEINDYKLQNLNYSKNEIDNLINSINIVSSKYALDANVKFFMNNNFETDRTVLKNLFVDINNTILTNNQIESLYIYFKANDQIITDEGSFTFKDFYDKAWYETAKVNSEKLVILPTRKVTRKLGGEVKENDFITLVRFFPLLNAESEGTIVINVSPKTYFNQTINTQKGNESKVFIIDDQFNYELLGMDKAKDLDLLEVSKLINASNMNQGYLIEMYNGEKTMISFTEPSNYGLRLIQFTPMNEITRNVNFMKRMLIIVILFISLAAIIIAYLLANQFYKPVISLMDIAKRWRAKDAPVNLLDSNKDELYDLKSGLQGITDCYDEERNNNLTLTMQIETAQKSIVRDFFRDQILGYNDITMEETAVKLKMANFEDKCFSVMVIVIDDYSLFQKSWNSKDQALLKFCITNISEELINHVFPCVIFEDILGEIIIITNDSGSADDIAKLRKAADQIREAVCQYVKVFSVSIGIGSSCDNINSINAAYNNAQKVLQVKWLNGKNITVCADDVEDLKCKFIYCLNEEKQLLAYLKQNDLANVIPAFKEFLRQLSEKNNNQFYNIYNGILQLLTSIIKMLYEMGYSVEEVFVDDCSKIPEYNLLHEYRKLETLSDVEKWMYSILSAITMFLEKKRKSVNKELIQKIISYINNNYNNDISLFSIAETVNMSESMMSKVFKQEVGENFLEYLSKLRIEKAKALLNNSDINISEISLQVGYANVQTFIRIFKKYEGITPGQYREDMKVLCEINSTF